jgi:hypothetical protein
MVGGCLRFCVQLHRHVAEKLCAEFAYNHSLQKPLAREKKNPQPGKPQNHTVVLRGTLSANAALSDDLTACRLSLIRRFDRFVHPHFVSRFIDGNSAVAGAKHMSSMTVRAPAFLEPINQCSGTSRPRLYLRLESRHTPLWPNARFVARSFEGTHAIIPIARCTRLD